MSTTPKQQESFHERLARISEKSQQPVQPVLAEETPNRVVDRDWSQIDESKLAKSAGVSVNPSIRENIKYPLSFVWAFLIGAFAIFLVRYIRFHLFEPSDAGALDAYFLIDIVLSGAIVAGIRISLMSNAKELHFSQYVGVFFMSTCMHNFYHYAPAPMAFLFSPEWVAEMRYYTVPGSIYYRGDFFVVIDHDLPEEQQTPTAWSLG